VTTVSYHVESFRPGPAEVYRVVRREKDGANTFRTEVARYRHASIAERVRAALASYAHTEVTV